VKTKDLLIWGGLAVAAYFLMTQSSSAGGLPAASQPLASSGAYGPVTLPNGSSVTLNNNQISTATGVMTAMISGTNYALQVQADGSTLAVPAASS
jgi:hypothetical protein